MHDSRLPSMKGKQHAPARRNESGRALGQPERLEAWGTVCGDNWRGSDVAETGLTGVEK